MNTVLFIIDPQKDFTEEPKDTEDTNGSEELSFVGSLYVKGARADMERLAKNIEEEPPQAIVVTMDTHEPEHIAHPMWWVNDKGENPGVFTLISVQDVLDGKWKATRPEVQEESLAYVKELANLGHHQLCVWPYHCIKGTEGHNVTEVLMSTFKIWEEKTGQKVEYVYKGTNPKTEMYSGLKAEVVVPGAPETELNQELVDKLMKYDVIKVAGQAKSHCVASTVDDLIVSFGKDATKITILENCMSSVAGFEAQGEAFIKNAREAGCVITNVETKAKKLKM